MHDMHNVASCNVVRLGSHYQADSKRNTMPNTASTARSSDTRRYMLTGDVHLLLLNPEGLVLFGRRQNTGFEDGAWHVPAGHLEASESVVQALIREAKEEVGVTIAPEDVEFAHTATATCPSLTSKKVTPH